MNEMTRKQAALELGVSYQRIKFLSDRGTLQATDRGVTAESVASYKATRKNGRPNGSFKKITKT